MQFQLCRILESCDGKLWLPGMGSRRDQKVPEETFVGDARVHCLDCGDGIWDVITRIQVNKEEIEMDFLTILVNATKT